MAWHRKHRPKLISELHLTNVREALTSLMQTTSFPQVFLFAGPKGTGKTSASRILGAMLNDPKNDQAVESLFFKKDSSKKVTLKDPDIDSKFAQLVYAGSSFVVQEMDAASHRGIDDIRALKERAMLPPQEGKITVYILDEAHMLTTEAFNALLKLLEEPPVHALFILATTEFHKIPETITSRSFHLAFRQATDEELLAALQSVLAKEKVRADEEVLKLIVQRADGSFRDGVKLLESVVEDEQITLASVEKILGKNVEPLLIELVQAVLDKDETQVSQLIADLRQQKFAEKYVYQVLFSLLHRSLLQDLGIKPGQALFKQKIARFFLDELLKANLDAFSPINFLSLEIKLLSLVERAKQKNGATPPSKKKIKKPIVTKVDNHQVKSEIMTTEVVVSGQKQENFNEVDQENASEEEKFYLTEEVHDLGKNLLEQWDQFLKIVQHKNATVAALLRSSKPSIGDTGIPEVAVFYKFHQEQLQQQKYMNILQECTKDLVGSILPLHVSLHEIPQEATLVEVDNPPPQLAQLAEEALM
ncbi:MAG: DNA polymerase III subunit gamma/tau [Patescibacteria group bacterium]